MAEETRIHPVTGETLRRGVRPKTVSFAVYSETLQVPGWYPVGDGDAIHSGPDLAEWDASYRRMRSDYAKRVRTIRARLKLTQEQAGRIFGGGKRAFQKYETGKTPPSDAAIGLIEIIGQHPESLEVLRALPGRAA